MSFYLDVFRESIVSAGLISFTRDVTFFAMYNFGGFDMQFAAVCAVLGSSLGAIISFNVGRLIFKIYRKIGWKKHLTKEKYDIAARNFYYYFSVLLLFTWLPLLNILVLVAGFLGIRARLALPLIIAGKIAYYGYYAIILV